METRKPGSLTRGALLLELLRRERGNLPPPNRDELDEAVGARSSRYHVAALAEVGLVAFEPNMPRSLRLTDAGRAAALIIRDMQRG